MVRERETHLPQIRKQRNISASVWARFGRGQACDVHCIVMSFVIHAFAGEVRTPSSFQFDEER